MTHDTLFSNGKRYLSWKEKQRSCFNTSKITPRVWEKLRVTVPNLRVVDLLKISYVTRLFEEHRFPVRQETRRIELNFSKFLRSGPPHRCGVFWSVLSTGLIL